MTAVGLDGTTAFATVLASRLFRFFALLFESGRA
jgi:hypothetical protein